MNTNQKPLYNIVSTHTDSIGVEWAVSDEGVGYRVKRSWRLDVYYIEDEAGEPVSGLYDTAELARADMVAGAF